MFLSELNLINYRNYIKLELSFGSNLIIFSGRNGMGKTNILESIFLSSTGRSHRTPRDRELIKFGEKEALIRSLIKKREGLSQVEIILDSREQKKIKINAIRAQRLGELMGHINSVFFAPEDLRLVKGSPQERRRFIDMEISQVRPRYFYNLQQYNKVLTQRNNLLKDINDNSSLRKTLYIWDEQLAKIGSSIILNRIEFLEKIKDISKAIHKDLSEEKEELEISYSPSINLKDYEGESIEEAFLKELDEGRDEDIRRGRTEKGCHRDDLSIRIDNKDVRVYGSQGQQRTTALSLKLSEIQMMYDETGEYPLLLLDDVMSELDRGRQSQLLSYFNNIQTFITTTDYRELPIKEGYDRELYEIKDGVAKAI